jgi:hypothetical protein
VDLMASARRVLSPWKQLSEDSEEMDAAAGRCPHGGDDRDGVGPDSGEASGARAGGDRAGSERRRRASGDGAKGYCRRGVEGDERLARPPSGRRLCGVPGWWAGSYRPAKIDFRWRYVNRSKLPVRIQSVPSVFGLHPATFSR